MAINIEALINSLGRSYQEMTKTLAFTNIQTQAMQTVQSYITP